MKKPYFTPAIKVITLSSGCLLAASSVPSQNKSSLESEIAQLKGDLKKQKDIELRDHQDMNSRPDTIQTNPQAGEGE